MPFFISYINFVIILMTNINDLSVILSLIALYKGNISLISTVPMNLLMACKDISSLINNKEILKLFFVPVVIG